MLRIIRKIVRGRRGRGQAPALALTTVAASFAAAGGASAAVGVAPLPVLADRALAIGQLEAALVAYGRDIGAPVAGFPSVRRLPGDAGTARAVIDVVRVARDCHRLAVSAGSSEVRGQVLAPCAERLERAGEAAARALEEGRSRSLAGAPSTIDAWPVLRIDLAARDTTYVHDYGLLFDLGGNDVYDNNAGGNLLDVRRGPAGSGAPQQAPARGCEQVSPDHVSGGIEHPRSGPDCTHTATLLVDVAGDDRYGVLRDPGATDIGCTRTQVVRRIAIQGAAVAGVGILRDEAGDDDYVAKTLAQGAGHLGGVGVLHDLGGADEYLAIRNAQGFGVVGGVGSLRDDRGDDGYDFYVPAPRDPSADPLTEGSGGVRNDAPPTGELTGRPNGGQCDGVPRHLQGSGMLGGAGRLIDGGGRDRYRGSRPVAAGSLWIRGSQGFGGLGGAGAFSDLGGRDRYMDERRHAMPGRADDTTVTPASDQYPGGGISGFEDSASGG